MIYSKVLKLFYREIKIFNLLQEIIKDKNKKNQNNKNIYQVLKNL